jgi:hypothetical protein
MLIAIRQFSLFVFMDSLHEFDKLSLELFSLVLEMVKLSPRTIRLCGQSLVATNGDFSEALYPISAWSMCPKIRLNYHRDCRSSYCSISTVMVLLQSGLRNGDSIGDLWSRLHKLRSTLEDTFKQVLDYLNPEHIVQTYKLLRVHAAFEPPTLVEHLSCQAC